MTEPETNPNAVQRIGLFGGSFDPVHLGHLLVAQAAFEELSLSRLCFIPAAQSPFKPGMAPAPHPLRLAMLRLALAGQPRFAVDDQETRRGGTSYSIDTVRDYQTRFPAASLHYLIGADHAATLPHWRDAAALADSVEFVVVPRPGQVVAVPGPPFRCRILGGFPIALSSSHLRHRVRTGLPVHLLLPPAVAEFVRNNRLYL
jgi:nicotinate-nucleotide adenylyltransferase